MFRHWEAATGRDSWKCGSPARACLTGCGWPGWPSCSPPPCLVLGKAYRDPHEEHTGCSGRRQLEVGGHPMPGARAVQTSRFGPACVQQDSRFRSGGGAREAACPTPPAKLPAAFTPQDRRFSSLRLPGPQPPMGYGQKTASISAAALAPLDSGFMAEPGLHSCDRPSWPMQRAGCQPLLPARPSWPAPGRARVQPRSW